MLNEMPEYESLIKKYLPVSEFQLDLEIIENPPLDYINLLFDQLRKHKNYDKLKRDLIYDKDMNILIHIHNRFHYSEISDFSKEEVFFYPFMNKKEIKQAFNIKTSIDYLLRLRAEQVETEMRLKRTFSKLKKKFGEKWSFTNYFESKQYKKYLNKLKSEVKKCCINIPHGTIHSNEANGMCLKTPFGNIIVLSYALREFLFYMNLFYFGNIFEVKAKDIHYAFILASRIMLGTESLDFEIDTRGKLPKSLKKKIDELTDWQMNFVIGHEYAHHYLGHLENNDSLKSHNRISVIGEKIQHYTHKQKCEFEADLHAITETTYEDEYKSKLVNGAFMFFIYLQMYEKVENYLFPKNTYSMTHPEPIDRLWKLRKSININWGYSQENLENIILNTDSFMNLFLKNYLPFNVETIEMKGSVYLPSYKKKILIDRLDI